MSYLLPAQLREPSALGRMSEKVHHEQHDVLLWKRMHRKLRTSWDHYLNCGHKLKFWYHFAGFITHSVLLVQIHSDVLTQCKWAGAIQFPNRIITRYRVDTYLSLHGSGYHWERESGLRYCYLSLCCAHHLLLSWHNIERGYGWNCTPVHSEMGTPSGSSSLVNRN